MGILYENPYIPIIKIGRPTKDTLDLDFDDDYQLAGFYGAANQESI